MADEHDPANPTFNAAVRAAAFGVSKDAAGFVLPPASKATEREPLTDIQARLRRETQAGLWGGRVWRGRQV